VLVTLLLKVLELSRQRERDLITLQKLVHVELDVLVAHRLTNDGRVLANEFEVEHGLSRL
jgi:hypothetical protein